MYHFAPLLDLRPTDGALSLNLSFSTLATISACIDAIDLVLPGHAARPSAGHRDRRLLAAFMIADLSRVRGQLKNGPLTVYRP